MLKAKLDKIPETLSILNNGNNLEIIHKPTSRMLLIPALITGFFLMQFISHVSPVRNSEIDPTYLIILLVVYLIFMIFSMESYLGKTHVYINRGSVKVAYKPFSLFKKSKEFKSHTIKQLYVKEVVNVSKSSSGSYGGGRTTKFYCLIVQFRNGTEKELLNFPWDYKSAKAIEEQIEEFLKIEDEYNINAVYEGGHYSNLMK